MRTRNYHIGYDKELVVIKGPIKRFTDIFYDKEKGMMITAELDDNMPMVEYGVIAWPINKPIPNDHQIKTEKWKYFKTEQGWEDSKVWDYYISRPVQTFTQEEVQAVFEKYFAPFLREGDEIGESILKEYYEREKETRDI